MHVDLIYVEYTDSRTMSVALWGEPGEGMLGPVPSQAACTTLAPLLQAKLPERFPTVKEAENALGMIHMRNMLAGRNSAGQDYPYKVDCPQSQDIGKSL